MNSEPMSIDDARAICDRVADAMHAQPALLMLTIRTHRQPGTEDVVGRSGLTPVRLASWREDGRVPCVSFWDPDRVAVQLGEDPRRLRQAVEIVRRWRDTTAGRKVYDGRAPKRALQTEREAVNR